MTGRGSLSSPCLILLVGVVDNRIASVSLSNRCHRRCYYRGGGENVVSTVVVVIGVVVVVNVVIVVVGSVSLS